MTTRTDTRETDLSMQAAKKSKPVRARQVVPGRYFRSLASRLLTLREGSSVHKSIGVISCGHHEGNSTVASNLAIALVEAIDGEVLVVCAVEPSSQRKRSNKVGWQDLIFGNVDPADVIRRSDVARLDVLGPGLPLGRESGTYSRQRLETVVSLMKERYEFIIFDLPCLHDHTGGLPIASVLDGVILNVQSGRIGSAEASRAVRDLRSHGAHLIGSVLNDRRSYLPNFLRKWLGLSTDLH